MQTTQTQIQIKGLLGSFRQNPRAQYRITKPASMISRSALIGLLACCMGIERNGNVSELETLQFEIQDRNPGAERMSDYHTVKGAVTNGGTPNRASVTHREYMVGIDVLVTISGEPQVIGKVQQAVTNPAWVPYIGSRACPLSAPLVPMGFPRGG